MLLGMTSAICPAGLRAKEYRVPRDAASIQAAIDQAGPGDTIVVHPGRYAERLRLKSGMVVRSAGDDTMGHAGLLRAENTVLDGGNQAHLTPGVTMAENSTLDGFTVTGYGVYDEQVWDHHFRTQGNELADEMGAAESDKAVPAILASAVNCTIRNNIVHHNGDVGIGLGGDPERAFRPVAIQNLVYRNMGGGIGVYAHSEALVSGNRCYENLRAGIGCAQSQPLISANECFGNVRAGIGCRRGATPIVRDNRCHHNRRAGIGIRMQGTAPLVQGNECFENEMAGIGCRDEAEPTLRDNLCRNNKQAGIGSDGAFPTLVSNVCRANQQAGIGIRGRSRVIATNNQCLENRLVAIGVTQQSHGILINNRLKRSGGMPPLIAVKEDSRATLHSNQLHGGGVAAILVQGSAVIADNQLQADTAKSRQAIWVQPDSRVTASGNTIRGYPLVLQATGSEIQFSQNQLHDFQKTAIRIRDSKRPPYVVGNRGSTRQPVSEWIQIQGQTGIVADNQLTAGEAKPPGS